MTDTESVPTVGSRIGRYLIIREVAQGSIGSLFIAEREVGEGVGYGLARVVSLPSELPAHDEQSIADAIWDSTHLNHELALRVADVITGKGWITLIHEHSEGSLLSYLLSCARQNRGAFPAKVASRMALDVIEGLEQSRDLCASAGIPWRPGSVSPGSLLLGPDGRVRAMDGQITAAVLRVPTLRNRSGVAAHAAPELLDETREPSERADVFSIGVLLWELLTGQPLFAEQGSSTGLGHGSKVPKLTQAVPAGVKVPQGLVHTVHTALEADPSRRQSSLRELAVAIVMGVEDVSTYEQVLEFTDGLLLASASDAPAAAASEAPPEVAPTSGPAAGPIIFSVETPAARTDASAPSAEAVQSAAATAAAKLEQEPASTDSSREQPKPHSDVERPNPDAQDEVTGQRTTLDASTASTPGSSLESTPVPSDADASVHRQKLGTLPGYGEDKRDPNVASSPIATASVSVTPPVSAAAAVEQPRPSRPAEGPSGSEPTPSVPPPSTGPFRLVHDEPFVPIAVKPVQAVGDPEPSSKPAQQSSSRPPTSAAPGAALVANSEPAMPSVMPKRTVQLSMGTIVFGILTTVLAVVVVMLIIQQRPPVNAGDAPVATGKAGVSPAERAQQPHAVAEEPVAAVSPAAAVAALPIDAGVASPVGAKADHHKHASGTPAKSTGKTVAAESDTRTESKPTEQPTNRHFIPNEL